MTLVLVAVERNIKTAAENKQNKKNPEFGFFF